MARCSTALILCNQFKDLSFFDWYRDEFHWEQKPQEWVKGLRSSMPPPILANQVTNAFIFRLNELKSQQI